MDLDMPRLDGIEATRRVLADRPNTAVLVLTSFSDRPRIMGALEAGASGYLLKDVEADEVAGGLRRRARGGAPAGPARAPPRPHRASRARSARGAVRARARGARAPAR